jgi:hypothetical protein
MNDREIILKNMNPKVDAFIGRAKLVAQKSGGKNSNKCAAAILAGKGLNDR